MPMKADDPNFKGFRAPQYTQVPNEVFDHLLPDMDETELRVTLIAIRKTLGWHKTRDAISLSTFVDLTGLSRQGVLDGIEKAKARGTLVEVGKGKRGINIYELVITDDQSNQLTSLTSRPVLVNSVDQSDAPTSLTSRPTKERNIKKLEKDIAPNGAVKPFDAMKNAIHAAFGYDDKTTPDATWRLIGKAASELLKVGATPDDIPALYRYCKANFTNFKAMALVTNWSDFQKVRPQRPPATTATFDFASYVPDMTPVISPVLAKGRDHD